jgi:hypothetical protein
LWRIAVRRVVTGAGAVAVVSARSERWRKTIAIVPAAVSVPA